MRTPKILAATVAGLLLLSPLSGCGDDEGEDEIGDGEVNDEGD